MTHIAKFWKKLVRGNHEQAPVSPWAHFKPYLRYCGPVVWILEALIYPSVTFWSTIFGRQPKLRDPYCKILKKMVWGNHRTAWVSPWAHFKPYLRYFGAVVCILEASIYPCATFQSTIFEWYTKFWDPYSIILEKFNLRISWISKNSFLGSF